METVMEYYLPGFDHKNATDEEFFRKYAHLEYIRQEEKKQKNG